MVIKIFITLVHWSKAQPSSLYLILMLSSMFADDSFIESSPPADQSTINKITKLPDLELDTSADRLITLASTKKHQLATF